MDQKTKNIILLILGVIGVILVLKFIIHFWWSIVVALVFFALGYFYRKGQENNS